MLLWVNYTNETSRLFLYYHNRSWDDFGDGPYILHGGEFVFAQTTLHTIHLLKVHCHYLSLHE